MTSHQVVRVVLIFSAIAYGLGIATAWRFAKASERFRRALVDWRHYIRGARGQAEVVRNNAWFMLKAGFWTVVVVVVAGFLFVQGVKR